MKLTNKIMKHIKIEEDTFSEVMSELFDLETFLNDRISDLHKVKGGMQARHAYILYRNILMNARLKLRDSEK